MGEDRLHLKLPVISRRGGLTALRPLIDEGGSEDRGVEYGVCPSAGRELQPEKCPTDNGGDAKGVGEARAKRARERTCCRGK